MTAAGKQVVYVLATRGEAGSENAALTTEQVGQLREREEIAAAREVEYAEEFFIHTLGS